MYRSVIISIAFTVENNRCNVTSQQISHVFLYVITCILVRMQWGCCSGFTEWEYKWCVSLSGRDGLRSDFVQFLSFIASKR